MLKFFVFILFSFSMSAFAEHIPQSLSVKDHLRLSLWFEGVEKKEVSAKSKKSPRKLPIEIEKALVNF